MEIDNFDMRSYLLGHMDGSEGMAKRVNDTCKWPTKEIKDWGFYNGYPVENSYEYTVGCDDSRTYSSTPDKLSYKFCPYCGKEIMEIKQ